MKKISPFLWFNNNAEEAINFYVSLFPNSKIASISRYGDFMPAMKGKVLTAVFELNGQQFMALDGGPQHPFTDAVSFFINCDTQEEVDALWDKLKQGGKEIQCGWIKDRFGLVWQIIPALLGKLMQDKDPAKAKRVAEAMMKMIKIDSKKLQEAYDQK